MEKYGFVYIWYDRKHKRYYVGCHWGTEDDGYVCSSSNMKSAYKRRPEDFKRRILSRVYSSKKDLLEKEFDWISKIKSQELGKRYYNLHNHHFSHWSTCELTTLSLKERISAKTKEAMYRPEVRERYLEGLKTRDTKSSDPATREKRRQSMMGKNKGKDTSKAVRISAEKRRGIPLTEEHKAKVRETSHFKTLNNKKVSCVHCGAFGNPGNIGRYHNDRCRKIS